MIVLQGSAAALLNCRFALSPLWETVETVYSVLHRRPRTRALDPLPGGADPAGLDLSVLAHFLPRRGYVPDFLTPPPDVPRPSLEEQLERVAAVPSEQVGAELSRALAGHGRAAPAARQELVADPAATRDRMIDTIRAAWHRLVEPGWDAMTSVLEADVRHRGEQLARHGLGDVLSGLYPAISLDDAVITVDGATDAQRALDDDGLLLVPSVAGTRGITVVVDPPWQPMLVYRARGSARVAEATADGPLSTLVGPGRAEVLTGLDTPVSTTRLAARLGRSASTVSRHLSILRSTGLADCYRTGHDVLYYRTGLGDALLRR